MYLSHLGDRELDALIADRYGNRVYRRGSGKSSEYYLLRDGVEVPVLDYSGNATWLPQENAIPIIQNDPSGQELFDAALAQAGQNPRRMAEAFVATFVGNPEARLEQIKRRTPTSNRSA